MTIPLFEYVLDQAKGAYVPKGAVSGEILATGTTTGVDYATVELHQGAANPTGTLVATTTSGDDGWYSFSEIAAGDYTVVASKTRLHQQQPHRDGHRRRRDQRAGRRAHADWACPA